MKEIRIVVCPQLLEHLYEVLRVRPDFLGMTVTEVSAYPPTASQAGAYSIKEGLTGFVPRVHTEIVASDTLANVLFRGTVKVLEHGQTDESVLWMIDVIQATSLYHTG